MEKISSHVVDGLFKLIPPFWGLPRISTWLAGYLREAQLLEEVFADITARFNVDTADLIGLKVLGKIVLQPYYGEDVEVYRTLIRGRLLVNRSTGRLREIRELCDLLFTSVDYYEEDTLSIVVHVEEEGDVSSEAAAQLIQEAAAATVNTAVIVGGGFAFPDLDLIPTDTTFPDLDLDPTYAGEWPDRK